MSDTKAIIITEVAKILLTGYFTYARQQGMNKTELDRLYWDTKEEFLLNDPKNLEDM